MAKSDGSDEFSKSSNRWFNQTNVDFNTYQIIAVFTNLKPVNWEVEINDIIENANDLTVSLVETEGGFTVVTQPFHIVAIPKTTKPIIFI